MTDYANSIEELTQKAQEMGPIITGLFIDTSIQKEEPSFYGFPRYVKYSSRVSVSVNGKSCSILEENAEGPDEELIRCQARYRALEIGLTVARDVGEKDVIKINDLAIGTATQQLEVYRKELEDVRKDHKDWMWM